MRGAETRDAVISPDGVYRYQLSRVWDAGAPLLGCGMLNPSKADGRIDDPTIRVCIGRAWRLQCGGILVWNLFAYRATDPIELYHAPYPIGPENDDWILKCCEAVRASGGKLLVAWGDHGLFQGRAAQVRKLLAPYSLHHLGLTKAGQPHHPLYVAYATPLQLL